MNIPNILSCIRIGMIPLLVLFFFLPVPIATWGAGVIFAAASFTDWLDGYLARSLNQTSKLGAFLDPVADKLLVASALVLLVSDQHLHYIALPALIIVGREIVISALREWMAELGKRQSVAVSNIGKLKTVLQMIAITGLLVFRVNTGSAILMLAYLLFYGAALLTLWSMLMYLKAAWPDFRAHNN